MQQNINTVCDKMHVSFDFIQKVNHFLQNSQLSTSQFSITCFSGDLLLCLEGDRMGKVSGITIPVNPENLKFISVLFAVSVL